MLERAECEAYDDEPMHEWADEVPRLLSDSGAATSSGGGTTTITRATTVAEPFTRAMPVLAPLCPQHRADRVPPSTKRFASSALTSPNTMSVRRRRLARASSPATTPPIVDAWLDATGLRGDTLVEVDGDEQTLRDALISCYDFSGHAERVRFIAEHSREASALRGSSDKLKWLVGRNGLDLVHEFVVHADPDQWLRSWCG